MLYAGIPYGRTINAFRRVITCLVVAALTILFFVVTISCVPFVPPAHGASPNDVAKAIAYVEKHTVEFAAILATEDEAYYVKIHERTFLACGKNVGMNVSRLAIKNPWSKPPSEATILTSVHVTIGKDDDMHILMDLNADGTVDQVVPNSAGTRESMQPEFDRIIACIAAPK